MKLLSFVSATIMTGGIVWLLSAGLHGEAERGTDGMDEARAVGVVRPRATGGLPIPLPPSVEAPLPASPETDAPIDDKDEPTREKTTELAMELFLAVADLPGARQLAMDIKAALEDDPAAFDFSAITTGPDHELRPDYLEHMIRDPETRAKWVELMEIVRTNG